MQNWKQKETFQKCFLPMKKLLLPSFRYLSKKRIILSMSSLLAFSFSAFSQSSSFEFTYANGEASEYGKGKKENVDVAILIDDSSLTGMKLKGITAYISTSEGIGNTSVWLSKALTLQGNANQPDIATYDVTPKAATLQGGNCAVLNLELPTPYILTGEPVYVGYSMTIEETETQEQRKPIIISSGANPNGFFLHMNKSVLQWKDNSQSAGGVAYIIATIEGNISQYAIGIKSNELIYADLGEEFEATFMVENTGLETISNISYQYNFDGGSLQTGYAELASEINPSLTTARPLTLSFNGVEGIGPHDLNIEITEVNGQPNESENSKYTATVNVIPFVPDHRPLVEEFTGLWCGWCPRGFLAMEMLAEDYPDQEVIICYHYDDAMQVTDEVPVNVQGLPGASIDRQEVIDPYYGSVYGTEFGIAADMLAAKDELAVAAVNVSSTLEGDEVKATATITFIRDIADANYEIGYVLVANGLSDPLWYQTNYFADQKGYAGTPLEVLTTWSSRVEGLIFNDVAVDASAMMGVEGSIPAEIKTAKAYTDTYTFNIAGNEMVQNRENLVVAAFVIDKDTNLIVNSNKCKIGTAGISSIVDDSEVVSTEYYDLTGRRVKNPGKGAFIKVEKMSNGRSRSSKTLLK